jgi:hypothetical protein
MKISEKDIDRFKEIIGPVCKKLDINQEEINALALVLKESLVGNPQKIQGYTAEQWQEIIDGGYLCEFSMVPLGIGGHTRIGELCVLHHADGKLWWASKRDSNQWSHCRPAQLKGVMRPIFVEPVDKETAHCMFFNKESSVFNQAWVWWREREEYQLATKYIEV